MRRWLLGRGSRIRVLTVCPAETRLGPPNARGAYAASFVRTTSGPHNGDARGHPGPTNGRASFLPSSPAGNAETALLHPLSLATCWLPARKVLFQPGRTERRASEQARAVT